MDSDYILSELRSLADPRHADGMVRAGISREGTLGIPMPPLRAIARRAGRDHRLAQRLWASGIHEARLLAAFVDDPAKVTEAQMERWARDFDSWDTCDVVCGHLFDKTPFAHAKAVEWSARDEEFVKRAGFALMAALSVHDKDSPDEAFRAFLPVIAREAGDGRKYVMKAVNWALRQIGKRNRALHACAVETALEIRAQGSRSARWIAADAIRELRGPVVARILARQESRPLRSPEWRPARRPSS